MVGTNNMRYVEKRINLTLINTRILLVLFEPLTTFTTLCDRSNTKEFIRSVKILFPRNCGLPR